MRRHSNTIQASGTTSYIGNKDVLPAFGLQVVRPYLDGDASVETAINLVPHKAQKRTIDTVLSNSFGFGGTNASLVLRRWAA